MNVYVPYTQAGRMMAIATRLGADQLLLTHLDVREGIDGLFEIHAGVKAQRDDLAAGDLIGSTVDVSLQLKDGGTRWWNGFVTDLHEGPPTTRGTRSYAMIARPKLWLLSQTSDCRIFQNLATPQIIEMLCKEHDIFDLDLRVTQRLEPQLYSVQWNETDLAYMLRRMAQEGLFYWHDHDKGKHTLVVADHQFGYRPSSQPEVRYTLGSADQDRIGAWRRRFAFTPGKRSGRDWNFLTMQAPGATQATFAAVPGNAAHELYEYPGLFTDSMGAEQRMKSRIQATETGFETVEATSTVRTLGPGQTFTPKDTAKPDDVFAAQVVTAIRHQAEDPTYEASGGIPSYDNSFSVMPATTPATPHRTVPRPKITGSQIALIAGPAGEEIHTDEFGRVKLWFPWDRRAVKDGSDTCWIRVGQPWAGGTWGHQVIPRVGMEAIVTFEDGDPDRPLVTALVPDPTNPTPYPLPDNKTRMVFRSNSYKSSGYNEMTFEDKTSGENMFFHAQKDHTTKIENNQTQSVGANHSNVVGQNQALTVGANQTQEIGGSANLTVGGTGSGAAALMAPLAGMAGQTASLLGSAMSAAGGGGMGALASMVPQLASSVIGMLGSSGQQAQQGVWNGPSPRPDAGTALASAGGLLGQAAQSLFQMPGMMNTIVGTMRTDHVGVARIEQIGTTKVTNVGATFATQVGKAWSLTVGESHKTQVGQDLILDVGDRMQTAVGASKTIDVGQDFEITAGQRFMITVGGCKLQMDSSGIFLISGSEMTIVKGPSAQITLGSGPVLYSPALVEGTVPANPAPCLKRMADAGSPFVKN